MSKIIMLMLFGMLVVLAGAAISSIFFMLAWNASVVSIFSLPRLDLLQSFCLVLVAHILARPAKAEISSSSQQE